MQRALNKAFRFIHGNEQEQLTTSELRMKYNIAPLNISNYQSALKTFKTIKISEGEQYNALVIPYHTSYTWFPKSSKIITMEPPQAIIT